MSEGPFRDLNLSFRNDRSARVRENRRRVTRALGIPPLATARQVHGSHVGRVESRIGPGRVFGRWSRADGLTTSRRGTPLAVLAADCAPVVMASEEEGRVTVVHAGWRGVAGGVLAAAAARFASLNTVRVAIGPTIGPCHYEVGTDVVSGLRRAVEPVAERRENRLFLDLPGTVEGEVRRLGVPTVELVGECTACSADRFFSHRRDGITGRQALIAMRL